MSITTTITQFFGWKNQDVFDVLISLANNDNLKTNLINLKNKYNGLPHGFRCEDMPNPDTLNAYFLKHCNDKRKQKLIKLLEDETTSQYVMFVLSNYLKAVIDTHPHLNLKLIVYQCQLCLYIGDIKTTELFDEDSQTFSFPSNQLLNINIDPRPSIITCATNIKAPSYPNSCEPSPVCSRCQCDD